MDSRAFYDVFKRTCDVLCSLVALVLLSPIFIVVALVVFADVGVPIIFVQCRPGQDGVLFNLYKFRTMKLSAATGVEAAASDEVRITPIGNLLRKLSLDELPELYNILKGDMSFVGPRPLLEEYLPLYSTEQARRHEVRPGLTGWAQVCGRNTLDWPTRFALDVYYVDHRGLFFDLKILVQTIVVLARGTGATPENRATSEPFQGER